jgi:fatty-acyl-CoA synthase
LLALGAETSTVDRPVDRNSDRDANTISRVNPDFVVTAIGELAIKAPNVVQCYWPNRPALDALGYFRTGDLAEQMANGCYRVVGRVSEMVITGGENVYPMEVEQVLQTHPAVAQAAVLGLPDSRWGELVAAAVVLKPDFLAENANLYPYSLTSVLQNKEQTGANPEASAALCSQLIAHCQAHLAKYKCPKRVWLVSALPTTALGKVQKPALKAQLLELGAA